MGIPFDSSGFLGRWNVILAPNFFDQGDIQRLPINRYCSPALIRRTLDDFDLELASLECGNEGAHEPHTTCDLRFRDGYVQGLLGARPAQPVLAGFRRLQRGKGPLSQRMEFTQLRRHDNRVGFVFLECDARINRHRNLAFNGAFET
ncbi:hypothetical protein C41B8_08455 [Salinisphaera hydrothermalis C41B8]|uniref:Uncharacterized protein n=1 Tax=Salinisphaera hydrothermalis (strain C41B8) TaxID=1304275 RepID=A0A084IM99_SALHC|nr:hypothetical protein C41B8_08455 [Salinisphaera hydrothermalis C41B8]